MLLHALTLRNPSPVTKLVHVWFDGYMGGYLPWKVFQTRDAGLHGGELELLHSVVQIPYPVVRVRGVEGQEQ